MVEKKTDALHMRVDANDLRNFKVKCKVKYKTKHTTMLCDLIKAFNEDRVKIIPSKAQKQLFTGGD